MTDSLLSSTLREVRAEFARPVQWVALTGVGVVLALAGAFGTADVLRPIPLALYWIAVVFVTYPVGSFFNTLVHKVMTRQARAIRITVAALATCVAVFCMIVVINTALFGWYLTEVQDWASFAASVLAVTCVVSVVLDLAFSGTNKESGPPVAPPALLDRLPLDKRAALVAISVEDHYVQIRTRKGSVMVLLRLSDAIREVGDTPGAQVHRSHWVAWDAVTAARREGDRAILTLCTGDELPVSRANLAKIRDAGLLPK